MKKKRTGEWQILHTFCGMEREARQEGKGMSKERDHTAPRNGGGREICIVSSFGVDVTHFRPNARTTDLQVVKPEQTGILVDAEGAGFIIEF